MSENNQTDIDELKEKIRLLELENESLKMAGKYKSIPSQYRNEDILRPPAYIPTENEILLAKARYAMEEHVYSIFFDMQNYISFLEGKELPKHYDEKMIKKNYDYSVAKWDKAMSKWDDCNELFEAFVDDDWFKKCYIESLSDIHMGDCTAFPSSCMRCHAEEIFRIPNTVNWGKHEGYKLFSQYSQDIKEKTQNTPNDEL